MNKLTEKIKKEKKNSLGQGKHSVTDRKIKSKERNTDTLLVTVVAR